MFLGTYDTLLVMISWLLAVLAAYTALVMAQHVGSSTGRAARWWLAGGSFAMGFGIWSMHFVGMLAFSLPIPLGYDVRITALSLLAAIAASVFALREVSAQTLQWRRLVLASVILGGGIAAMHYIGMYAMRMAPPIVYAPLLVGLSIVIAVVASGTGFWIIFWLRQQGPYLILYRIAAALALGCAVVGMHYTGMAAADFPLDSVCLAASGELDPRRLAAIIIILTLSILGIALVSSVWNATSEARTAALVESLAIANHELSKLALQDKLTKLPNRAALEDRLPVVLSLAQQDATSFALMFMDLDGFKAVNDTRGHYIGDLLLIEVAERLKGVLRLQDMVLRLGGDEFVLVLEQTDAQGAATVASKVVHCIGQPYLIEKHELRVAASVGIAVFPHDGDTVNSLMGCADAAMYHVKNSGGNAYQFFEPLMTIDAGEQLRLMHELQTGIERHEFFVTYQFREASADGACIGAEAILHWQHPLRGVLGPEHFWTYAEKTGLIVPIGEWLIDAACRQMQVWHQLGQERGHVAVRVSSVQFTHPRFTGFVEDTLRKHQLAGTSLLLEVSESTVMRNAERSLDTMHALARLGVEVAIDEFGAGYFSLVDLKRMPIAKLIIDQTLVRALDADGRDIRMISTIIAMGHTLGLRILAKGVDTAARKQALSALGCDVLQGACIGEPSGVAGNAGLPRASVHQIGHA